MTVPAKVQRAADYIESCGNTVAIDARTTDHEFYGFIHYAIHFESLQTHALLKTFGSVYFAERRRRDNSYTHKDGNTRFGGGYLHGLLKEKRIRTYRDLDIIIDVYTPTPPEATT